MNYEFPYIETIDPLLELIKGKPEFILAERSWYNIITYVVQTQDTFPAITSNTNKNDLDKAILLRECRGIAFDKNGKILSRPYQKFFNLNERFETQSYKIDFNEPHSILEKLDGSMIRPFFNEEHNGFRLATKMGVTDVAMNAEVFVAEHVKYFKFFRACYEMGITPIFEWLSNKNRIVINYEKDNLVLTALRWTWSGSYFNFENMQEFAGKYDIPCVGHYGTVKEISNFLTTVNDYDNMEGFVIRFNNGHMIKIKTEEYLIQHKSKDIVSSKKRIIEHILNETIDDLKPRLIADDLKRVEETEVEVFDVVKMMSEKLQIVFDKYNRMDRKNFALNIGNKLTPFERKGFFSMMDGKQAIELSKDFLSSNVKTKTLIGNLKKQYNIFVDVED